MVHSCVGTTSTSEDRPLVRTRACGTALTAVYVHHIGTRVTIPHTYTDTTYWGVTHSNLVRGAKMPAGSPVWKLPLRDRNLHTRAADGEHTCRLLPVAACLRVLAGACLSIPIHPRSRTRTSSLPPITCEYYLFQLVYMYMSTNACLCVYETTHAHTHTHTRTHTHIHRHVQAPRFLH